MGTGGYLNCPSSTPPSCCDSYSPCPVGPGTPTPTIPPNCGGISQPCCPGNTCTDPALTCYQTMAGWFCLSQGQIGQIGGTSNPIWCDPSNPTAGVKTALGCLQIANPSAFVAQLLPWAVRLGGLIAFLSIIYAGFIIVTSGGDAKKVAAGRELITAAILGLAFIALSVVILNFIGIQILQLGPLGFVG